MFEFKTSKKMQELADSKEGIADIADISRWLEVEDCSDDVGSYIDGVKDGIELVLSNPKSEFWLVTFADYGDADGQAIFVGSEEEILKSKRLCTG